MIYKERETGWRELTYPKVGEAFLTVCYFSSGCVDNYLEECLKTNSLPVANDGMGRLCELSWYNR